MMDKTDIEGRQMYTLAERLFPICRSITGDGVRQTLSILGTMIPDLRIFEVPSGTAVFDWTVPKEWNIRGGYIETLDGRRIVDFKDTNLHIMGYSLPVDQVISREELLTHIYTMEDQPDLIPYVTSYYKERWGFCMEHTRKLGLSEDQYHVVIDSSLENGSLTYGEAVLTGETDQEIFFSTYVCHPSIANNELSGPVLAAQLYRYLTSLPTRRYTYRFLFIPETIGSITYLSSHLDHMKNHVKAGFVLTCVGDDHAYSYVESRYANTLADKVAQTVLQYHAPDYKRYSFLDRGSDERQYCSAGVDLPVCTVCRSKYGMYPEYHTSADDMKYISPQGLQGAYDLYVQMISALEHNYYYRIQCPCEPQLGKRGLYPTISMKGQYDSVKILRDFLAYADGSNDLLDISRLIGQPVGQIIPLLGKLMANKLIQPLESPLPRP